jgi:putative ABC transport system permease protein
MSALRELAARIVGFLARRGGEQELADELRFHLEMAEQEFRRRGLAQEDARREARRQLGGTLQTTEAYRDQQGIPFLETLLQDLRYGARAMRRTPGFALAAVATLGLGIGGNTAIFSLVNASLLRPLPFHAPERLVVLGDRDSGVEPSNLGFATFQDLRDRARSFETMAAIRLWTPTLAEGDEAERVPALRVSWSYFAMLGVRPALGRDFRREDDHPERWRVVMLSDGLWRRRFGASSSVVGRRIQMNDREYEVVGVLPPGFEPLVSSRFYTPAEMWAPLGYDATLDYACRSCQHLKALGRVREGVTLEQARADLDAIRAQLLAEHPRDYPAGAMAVVALHELISGGVRPALYLLLGAVGFVLLMACANVASLLLARSAGRGRELAIRAALGAGRRRLVRQLLTESSLLALAGGCAGLALAAVFQHGLARAAPVSIPRLEQAAIDLRVLLFAAGLSIATGLFFGLAPALRASSHDVREALAGGSRAGIGASSPAVRRLLVVLDLALALVLLAGAGLMLKSVGRLLRVDPGFDPERVVTMQLSVVRPAAPHRHVGLGNARPAAAEDEDLVAFQDQLLERVRALPGVEAAALAGQVPLGGNGDSWGFHIEGRENENPSEAPSVERYSVSPDYFRVMGIRLLRGRLLDERDRAGTLPVIVISDATARLTWPGGDPIGRRVRIGGADEPWRTVVGIVGGVHHTDLAARPTPQMYLPQAQVTDSFVVLTVKAAARAERLVPALRETVRGLDARVPVYDVATMSERMARTVAVRHFVTRLLGGFAAVSLLLAAIGLYGVVAYSVAQRTREFGLRIALGATPADIVRHVFASGFALVGLGLAAGLVGSLLVTRFAQALLFEVRPHDPQTVALAVAVLAGVSAVAHGLPVLRALRVDPALALRQE